MAYDKQTWKTGDVVTSAKLNHIEDGIAGGYLIVTASIVEEEEIARFDKTWNEIDTALRSGIPCYLINVFDLDDYKEIHMLPISITMFDGESYSVSVVTNDSPYYATTADDYPSQPL